MSTDQRRVVRHLDAEALEEHVGEVPVGPVDAFRQQDVVSAPEQGEINERERGLAAGHDERPVAVLELAHAGRELAGGRRSVLAVGVGEVVLVPRVARRRGVLEDRRGAPVHGGDEGPEALGCERVGLRNS